MSRSLQDQFIDDDEEETCPLCVEEFDLTDKGFRPCPCGYQICQFCYHNVKTNMNGLCPACRRPYRDEDIDYKVITPEETAAHKARQAQKQKKTQAALQKEKQRAEADNLSRKHLAGMRVVQKNLVYVTGLSPTTQEDQLLQTLRGDQYFGQYGDIIKIVVSKAKDLSHPHSVGVYVTYKRKEDAASCIDAVDGSKNGDRTLRAQFGTTKYCSAYLRGETCTNRNCMFLHEPGEANESYSRADLSALNAGSSQHGHGRPPPPQSQQPVSAAPMTRQSSDQPSSPSTDRPALPSTASWASKPPQTSRAESRSTSTTLESPAPANSLPVQALTQPAAEQESATGLQSEQHIIPSSKTPPSPLRRSHISPLISLLKHIRAEDFKFVWSPACIPEADMDVINNYPPLFDPNGGTRRRLRKLREEEARRMEQEAQAAQQVSSIEQDDNPEMSGSLQLGGEPEERQSVSQIQSAIQPPGQENGGLDQRFQFGGSIPSPGISERGMTPQQHQQLLLQTLKPGGGYGNVNQTGNFHSAFQQQPNPPPGHQRNVSRFSFANDSSASAAVKPVANAKLMNQQSSMMPSSGGNHFGAQHQQSHGQFYTSNVQGPPPGLKTTGTPPVSGNLTFGQGHGFATGGLQYGAGTSRNQQDNYYRELLRGRDAAGSGVDAKRGGLVDDPNTNHLIQARLHQSAGIGGGAFNGQTGAADDQDFPPLAPSRHLSITSRVSLEEQRRSTPPVPPGLEAQYGSETRRSTPTVPPGLAKPTGLPELEGSTSRPSSRPSSRASLRRTISQITPALPLRPGTPSRAPASRKATKDEDDIAVSHPVATPTKPARHTSSELKEISFTQESPAAPSVTTATSHEHETAASPLQSRAVVENGATTLSKQGASSAVERDETNPDQSAPDADAGAVDLDPGLLKEIQSRPEPSKGEDQKRKHPGKLDIITAVGSQEQEQQQSFPTTPVETSSPGKAMRASVQTPSSQQPDSPGIVASATKAAPRTLRVVQTPKTETPPPAPVPTPNPLTATHRLPSRQPSIASINQPGTPSSEHVSMSDNLSFTSASQSRANSPPPAGGKVGSAPVRTKTKNQLKKERQERAKAIEEEKTKIVDVTEKAPVEEPTQEAIVSRKKKAKKEKEPRVARAQTAPTANTTPTTSRPTSPGKVPPEAAAHIEASAATSKEPQPASSNNSMPPPPLPQPRQPVPSPSEPSPPPTPTLTAAQLVAELKASAPELQKCIDSLFRVSNGHHFKMNQTVSQKDILNSWKSDFNVKLSKDEVDALLTGKVPAVHRGGEDGRTLDRHMITPSGAHLRALTKELEARFLELEKTLREMPEEFRFRPSKPQNEIKLPSVNLEELKRKMDNSGGRGFSVMEQMVQDGSTMKKGAFLVDEASKYINEFVMPPSTPPPSAGGQSRSQSAAQAAQTHQGEASVPSVEIAERQMSEARRIADEKEIALKKIVKKNKRLLGLA